MILLLDPTKTHLPPAGSRRLNVRWSHLATWRRVRLGVVMRPSPPVLDPPIVAVLAATVSLSGAARPSFWYDEAATISASYSRSLSPAMADAGQCRRRPRPVLPAHARLVSGVPADGVLVSRAERSGCRRRGRRRGGVGPAVLVSHCRGQLRGNLRDTAPDDVGGYRSSAVCAFDDGRRVADRAARSRRPPRQRLGLAVLRARRWRRRFCSMCISR